MLLTGLAAPLALILATYAAIPGLSWARRVIAEPRRARQAGLALNLIRRAGPPLAAALLLLLADRILFMPDAPALAALIAAAALAYGTHRGLRDLGPENWRSLITRLLLTAALSLFVLWQFDFV